MCPEVFFGLVVLVGRATFKARGPFGRIICSVCWVFFSGLFFSGRTLLSLAGQANLGVPSSVICTNYVCFAFFLVHFWLLKMIVPRSGFDT